MASRRSPTTPRPSAPVPTLTPAPAPSRMAAPAAAAVPAVTREVRRAMIAENAYLRAEGRGFASGHETEDWLAAEAEVDALVKLSPGGSPQ